MIWKLKIFDKNYVEIERDWRELSWVASTKTWLILSKAIKAVTVTEINGWLFSINLTYLPQFEILRYVLAQRDCKTVGLWLTYCFVGSQLENH